MSGIGAMMSEDYTCLNIGPCTLYCGDALKILPHLIEKGFSADLVVSDPPYELTSGGCTKGGLHERFGKDTDNKYGNTGNLFSGEIPHWDEFMPLLYGCLKENAHCYTMADGRNQFDMQVAARAAGFRHHNLLEWKKGTYTPNRWYMKGTEFTGFFFKGKAFPINDCSSRQDIYIPQVDETAHPTEKPVMLMAHYIANSSQPGEIVIDPFMGTGTTAVAAIRLGRKFVGIERDRKWFDVACRRITSALGAGQDRQLFTGDNVGASEQEGAGHGTVA